jgi:hypothetical protein
MVGALLLPDGLKEVGNNGLNDMKALSEISIPASLLSIGQESFENCKSITKLTVN